MSDISYNFTDRSIQNVNEQNAKYALFFGTIMKTNLNFLLALLTIFLLEGPVAAQALDERSALHEQPIRCASDDSLRFLLPDNMVRIDIPLDGVLCAFRNKTGGFPTINVIRQPQGTAPRAPSLAERTTELVRSYGLVGLTDATVSDAQEMILHGFPAYSARVHYTNQNIPMATLVLILELPDRSYTVSALDTAEGLKTSENALREVLTTVTVEGEGVVADTKSTRTTGIGTLLLAIALAVGAVYLRRYLRR